MMIRALNYYDIQYDNCPIKLIWEDAPFALSKGTYGKSGYVYFPLPKGTEEILTKDLGWNYIGRSDKYDWVGKDSTLSSSETVGFNMKRLSGVQIDEKMQKFIKSARNILDRSPKFYSK